MYPGPAVRIFAFDVWAEADWTRVGKGESRLIHRGIVLTKGGWCDPVNKRSHHRKKGRKGRLGDIS